MVRKRVSAVAPDERRAISSFARGLVVPIPMNVVERS